MSLTIDTRMEAVELMRDLNTLIVAGHRTLTAEERRTREILSRILVEDEKEQ